MNTHTMKLNTKPFESLIRGEKTIESRLYDKKRQQVELGDTIIFTHAEDTSRAVAVKVIGLLRYANFEDMFTHNDPRKFGGSTVQKLLTGIETYYGQSEQAKYGVLGIEFELL